MARWKRGARGGASYRPAPTRAAPKSTRRTEHNFPRGQNLRAAQQRATSSQDPIYISSNESISGGDEHDDLDITVHYRLNAEGSITNSRKRGREDFREEETSLGYHSKRTRAERTWDRDAAPQVLYGHSDGRQDEVPRYKLKRRHLGALGRFGIDITPEGVPIVKKRTEVDIAPDLVPVGPQFSRFSFQADEIFKLDKEDHDDGEVEEGEVDGGVEVDVDDYAPEKEQGYGNSPINGQRNDRGRDYRFDFGQHSGAGFSDILRSDERYIKMIGGQPHLLDRWNGGLRAAFEYYCPDLIRHGNRPNSTAIDSNLSAGYHNAERGRQARPSSGGASSGSRHPRDYVFDFGMHNGKRFDQAPEGYLRMIEAQVLNGQMDRSGLKEAFEWHGWGRANSRGRGRGNSGEGNGRQSRANSTIRGREGGSGGWNRGRSRGGGEGKGGPRAGWRGQNRGRRY